MLSMPGGACVSRPAGLYATMHGPSCSNIFNVCGIKKAATHGACARCASRLNGLWVGPLLDVAGGRHFEALTVLTGEHRVGPAVADERFLLRVEGQGLAELHFFRRGDVVVGQVLGEAPERFA